MNSASDKNTAVVGKAQPFPDHSFLDSEDRIGLTTRFAILHTIPQAVATISLFFVSNTATALTMAAFMLLYVPVYLAHWRKWPLLGRIASPIAGMVSVAAFHIVMGPEWHIAVVLLSQVVLPFCIFTNKERRLTLIFALLPAATYVVLEGFVTAGPFVHHNLSPTAVRWFSMFPPTVACIDIYTRIRLLLDRIQKAADQAEQSRVKAVLADRAKSAFLANMSHEIRTPMNAVLAMSDLLKDTPLSTDQKELADTISSSARSLLNVINDILDHSKIEAGELTMREGRFNPRACTEDVASVLALKAREKGLSLKTVIEPQVPTILVGDGDRLKQVLFNLIGNGVKYTDRGEVRTRVAVLEETDTDVTLGFTIADTGIGIREADLPRLFNSFVQLDSSLTRAHGGTGLGLSISKQIVGLLGGTIDIKSTFGEGTEFNFSARFQKAPSMETEDAPSPVSIEAVRTPEEAPRVSGETPSPVSPDSDGDRAPARILVVEDNRVNQRVVMKILEKLGYESALAENGQIAVDMLKAEPFDLVLMDRQMPVMDGITATKLIRLPETGALNPNIPIIAVTAGAMKGDREEFLAAGMDDYLAKPIIPATLAEMLARRLAHRSVG